jgi:hypothetical protein
MMSTTTATEVMSCSLGSPRLPTEGQLKRVLFGAGGFANALRRISDARSDVELGDLGRLYNGE